jgi:hypothetical protein
MQSLLFSVPAASYMLNARSAFGQSPQSIPPNDLFYNAEVGAQMRLPEALYMIDQKERFGGGPNMSEVIALVFDGMVDSSHPDLAQNCIPELFRNFTKADPLDLGPPDEHGTSMAGHIASLGNNGIGIASLSLSPYNRIKIVSIGVVGPGGLELGATFKGFEYAMALKAQGHNVRVISCSFALDETVNDITRAKIRPLKDAGIALVLAAGQQGLDLDASGGLTFGGDPDLLVLTVTALERDNVTLLKTLAGQPLADWGNKTVSLAAPGRQVPGLSVGGGVGNGTGTSVSTALVSQAICAEILYGPEFLSTARAVQQVMAASGSKGLGGQIRPDGGVLDMYTMLGPSLVPADTPHPEPVIESTKLKGGKKLTIFGVRFGDNAQVFINGVDKSYRIMWQTDTEVFVKKQLGLVVGVNQLTVMTPSGVANTTFDWQP